MASNFKNRTAVLLNSTALSRAVLGTVSALVASTSAQAFDANSLPQGGTVTGGSATVATSGNTLTVNQSSNRAIIDWRSFDIGSNAQANFNQPGASSIAVNRVNGSTDPTRIEGGLHANGQVWILNPNGVLFGKTARVDAAGVVATTANIDDRAFMAGSNKLQMTGGDSGRVENEGQISVGEGGLAAFVAPSVRNSGTIRARVGKVTLAAGDTYTLDLAGDRLVELGLGSSHAVVDQSGKIVNAGGVIEISAKAAGQVVDSVINVSGVTSASSVKNAGGQIILGGDDINVASTASISADGTSGGQITAVANKTGNYAGSYSAQASNGDGGSIETSGKTVNIDSNIAVNTSAPKGKTGNWTLDPDNLTVTAGTGGSAPNGTSDGGTSTIGADTVVAALNTTDVTLQARNSITVGSAVDASGNTNAHNLTLADEDGGGLTLNLNAAITLKSGGILSGQGTTVNIGATGLIQNGIDAAAGGGTASVNLTIGATYREQVVITKNLTLNGAGATIESPDVLSHSFTYGAVARNAVVSVEGASSVNISDLTIDGRGQANANGAFLGLGLYNSGGTIDNVTITRVRSGGEAGTLSGGQNTYAFGAFNDTGTHTVILEGSNISDFEKDGAAFYGHGLTATVVSNTIQGAGPTAVNAQNGIVLIGASGTVNGNTISGISYSPDTFWATNIYLDDAANTLVAGNTVTGAGGPFGSSLGLYVRNSNNANITGNTFQNLEGGMEVDVGTTNLSLNSNTFTNNTTHFFGLDATQASVALASNTFDHTVVATGGATIYGSLQYAIDSEAAGSTLNLSAGTFDEALDIDKSIDLEGAGAGQTIIMPSSASQLIDTGTGHKYTSDVKATVFVHDTDGVTLNNLTINGNSLGNDAVVFWNNASGTISNALIENATVFNGAQTGQDLAVDATAGNTSDLTVSGVAFQNWNKNAIDAETGDGAGTPTSGGTITLNVSDSTFTGAGAQSTNAQNGIVLWEQGGGTVSGTVDGSSFSDIKYAAATSTDDWGVGVLIYGSPNGSLSVSNSSFTNVQAYISTAGGSPAEVDATTGNTFDGVAEASATSDDLFNIEDHLIHGTDDTSNGLVRIKAGQVYATATKQDIQNAIEAASVGDTVNVQAGTYNGTVTLDKKNLTLHSADQGGAVIDANGGAEGIIVSTTSGNLGTLTVDGFTVQNWTSDGIVQTMAAGSLASMRITNNTVYGPGGGATSHGNGIEVTGDDSVVSGNSVYGVHLNSPNWSGSNIIVANGSHITVTNNLVDGNDTGIAVTNWNNTSGMSDITISDNTITNEGEGISIQTKEGEFYGVPSGFISDVAITGNLLRGNDNGLGVWDYSIAHNASWGTTLSDVSGNTFTNNGYQVETNFTDGNVKSLLASNTFDHSVVSDTGGRDVDGDLNIYSGIQTAIEAEAAGSTLDVGAGTYNESVVLDKANTTLHSITPGGAVIDANGAAEGIIVSTTSGNLGILTVDGFTVQNWTTDGIVQTMAAGSLASMRITNNTVYGPGGAGAIAHGNGIEVTGDGSVVSGNAVYGVHLNSPDWSGSNIIVANGSHITVTNNLVDGNDTGIAVTNWNNTAGMSDITISGNTVTNEGEAISIQAYEGEAYGIPSGAISAVAITGNTISGNGNGLGVWDYSDATNNPSWATTFSAISGNTFTNNDYQVSSDFADAAVTPLLSTNSFDRSVVNATGGRDADGDLNIYGGLQTAIDAEAAGSILNVGAGTYNENVVLASADTLNFAGSDLDSLQITAGGAGAKLSGNLKAGSVTALANIVLGGDLSVDTTQDNGAIALANVDGAHALTLNAGSGTVALGNAGATTRLGALSVTGATTLTGGTYKAASVNLASNTTLGADTSIDTSASNGALTVSAVNGAHALTLNAGTGTVTLGNAGATTRLGALSVTGATTLTGGTYKAASVNLAGNTTLGADANIDTSASNGALTVSAVNGAHALTLNAGTGTLTLGNAGATTRLGALSVTGATTLTGATYRAASANFGGKVTLTAATTVIDTTVSSTAAGNITFAGDIFGITDGAQSLTLSAGSGTGAKSANADISLQNAGTGAVRLGSMTVSGDDFSALTVDLAGNFAATLTGNQVFATDTLNAGGNVNSVVGGNASGHIVSGGAVVLNADGNISGTIASTGNVSLTAGNNITSNVSGGSVVTLAAGNNITGSISGQTVTLTGNVVIATVDADTLNLFAGGGTVGGSFTAGLVSNQQKINGQQLVVENFLLPAGTVIGANGALILPAGTVIGLLSPGGGPARVIMVTDVQTLGQLLSEGYVAIVIDLKAKKAAPVQVASN